MKPNGLLLLLLTLLLPAPCTAAGDPTYQLEGGGSVQVDPLTRRATVTKDGVSTPLYDGTHRTQDGSILIIRQGITTIPGEVPAPASQPEEAPAELWEGAPIIGYSPCERLVHRTCGKHEQCADEQGCKLARQLLDMEQDERSVSGQRNRMTFTSGQCVEAAPDTELFPACGQ